MKPLVHEEKLIRDLIFRPERSRPIWRNKHTGSSATVVDLAINDHGGFQGGCRQFVVVTDEKAPPGPPTPPDHRSRGPRGHNVHSLWSWLTHWEPTGDHIEWTEERQPTPEEKWRTRALDAERKLATVREALKVVQE